MGFLARLQNALTALTTDDITASTVRPMDVAGEGRYARSPMMSLAARYTRFVYIAANRNAQAVAGLKVRVMRRAAMGARIGFEGRKLTRDQVNRMLGHVGPITHRSLDHGDELIEITDEMHPLVRLLKYANPQVNGFELLETLSLGRELTGNGYLAAVNNGAPFPVELWNLPPQYVRVLPDRERYIRAYAYGTSQEIEQEYDASSMVHVKFANPLGDPYYGMGPLAACILESDISQAIGQHQLEVMNNGVHAGGLVNVPNASESQRKGIEAEMTRKYAGTNKSGRVIVSNAPKIDFLKFSMTEEEVGYLQSQKDVRETIANVFGMPVALLTTDTGSLAQAEEAVPMWHKISIKPRKQSLEDKLNEQLVPMFGELGKSLVIVIDDPENKQDSKVSAMVVNEWNAGLLRLNEARQRIGHDGVEGPEGDEFKASDAFGGLFGPSPADAKDKGTKDEATVIDEGEEDEATEPEAVTPDPEQMPSARSVGNGVRVGSTPPGIFDQTDVVVRDDKSVGLALSIERQMQAALLRWFKAIFPTVENAVNYEEGKCVVALHNDPAAVDMLAAAIAPKQQAAFVTAWNQSVVGLGARQGAAKVIATPSDRAIEYLEARRTKLLQSVSEAINDRITTALQDGIKAGEGIPQLSARVGNAMGTGATYASKRIAQTETITAYSGGSESAWTEAGTVKKKEWLESGDPCPFCHAMHGRTAPLNEPFLKVGDSVRAGGKSYTVTYQDVYHPALHPGCQCSLGAVFKDD